MNADLAPTTQRQGSWSTNMDYRTPDHSPFPAPPQAWAGPSGSKLMQVHNLLSGSTFRFCIFLFALLFGRDLFIALVEWVLQ